MDSIKVAWDAEDLKFFFVQIEDAMELIQIRSQWLKRQVLARALTGEVKAEVKDMLIMKKSEAGADIYKRLKYRLLELFGPRAEDAFEEAAGLPLIGKPSALAKKIMVRLCEKRKPLQGCCCGKTVAGIWKRQLPADVRAAVAGMDLAGDMDNVLKKADDVFNATSRQSHVAAVAVSTPDLDETQPALQVAAFKKPQKGQQQQQQKHKGAPHPDGPPEGSCYNHWRFGKSAFSCKRKATCPWKQFVKPKPNNNSA